MMYYYSCPNALFFLSTVLVNIRIKRKWLWFWSGTILVFQIGGIPADDDTISAKSIQIRWNYVLCTCQVAGDVCNIPCQHAPTLWAMTFILWHVVFDVTIAVNMCISSYSVNSCVTRIFAHTLQDLILLTILLSSSLFTTKYFLHYLFMWNASLLLTVQKRRVNCEPWTQPSSSVALSFGTCPYSTKTIVLYGQLYRDICKRRYRTL
jgi:hypothetical protein